MTIEIFASRKQSVVDELWRRANRLIETYNADDYGSALRINMDLLILEDNLMTIEEFQSDLYDEDLAAIYEHIWHHTKDHPTSPYREDEE